MLYDSAASYSAVRPSVIMSYNQEACVLRWTRISEYPIHHRDPILMITMLKFSYVEDPQSLITINVALINYLIRISENADVNVAFSGTLCCSRQEEYTRDYFKYNTTKHSTHPQI